MENQNEIESWYIGVGRDCEVELTSIKCDETLTEKEKLKKVESVLWRINESSRKRNESLNHIGVN